MRIKFTILSCKINPCSYVMTRNGTIFYYWSSLTHFAPIRFHYSNCYLPGFTYHAFNIFLLRKFILTIEFKTEIHNMLFDRMNNNLTIGKIYVPEYPTEDFYDVSPKKRTKRGVLKNHRKKIYERDDNKCLKCGTIKNLTIDHIVPYIKGGKNKISNYQTLCFSCNGEKGADIIDYRK